MERRRSFEHTQEPMSIYELHLGSWVKPDQAENPSLQRTPEGEGTVPGDAEVPVEASLLGTVLWHLVWLSTSRNLALRTSS